MDSSKEENSQILNPSWKKGKKEKKKKDEKDKIIHNLLAELAKKNYQLMKRQREFWNERRRLERYWKKTCLGFFLVGIIIGLVLGWFFL